jgi:hypothetical protein
MTFPLGVTRTFLVCLAVLASTAAAAASAQTDPPRSETGRHRPAPVVKAEPVEPVKPVPAPSTRRGDSRWFAGLDAGLQGGGDLWRTETVSGAAVAWRATTPFTSARFSATLDQNFAFGLFAGRQLSPRWSVRLDLNTARMDVAAEALQGQGAAVFLYDRLTMTTVGLAAEMRLVDLASYPYLSGGVLVNMISAVRENQLDQQPLGARLGVGYLQTLDPAYSLRLEARLSRTGFDAGSFLPTTTTANRPEQAFRPARHLNTFELFVAVQLNL